MILLKDINKTYNNGSPLHVLKGINLEYRQRRVRLYYGRFRLRASPPSSTYLGILDNYDTGEYYLATISLIKGISEKKRGRIP
jgi:putative ABC transport system ATP-binding protein